MQPSARDGSEPGASQHDAEFAERLDVARQVLVHLAGLGRLPRDEVARPEWTQAGMVDRLGARQGTISHVLTQLVAAAAVSTDRRHVRSVVRRVNVYYLTPLGELIVNRIREQRRNPDDPAISKSSLGVH